MRSEIQKREVARTAEHGAVLNKDQFLDDFGNESGQAYPRSRIHTTAMIIETGNIGQRVLGIFKRAPWVAEKTVRLDATSQLILDGQYGLPSLRKSIREDRKGSEEAYAALMNEFDHNDIKVEHVHMPEGRFDKMIPLRGRMHIKGSYVDNRTREDDPVMRGTARESVFYLHTNNYNNDNTAEIAVKYTGEVAERLIDIFDDTFAHPPSEDKPQRVVSDTLQVFVDAGKPGESQILDSAVGLVDHAESVLSWSWMRPDGLMADALQRAHERQAHVSVITSKSGVQDLQKPLIRSRANTFHIANTLTKLRGDTYHITEDESRRIHTKCIIVKLDRTIVINGQLYFEGQKVAFYGSHNLSTKGVKAGTQEMQFLTTDPQIINNLEVQFASDLTTTL